MAIRPLLITGGGGTLATAFDQMCENRGLARRQLTRAELDITDAASIRRVLREVQPWAVINAAGNVHVDVAEADGEQCYRDNRLGPKTLADACAESRIALATFSTDLVFDGGLRRPYTEEDATAPLSVFGAQKAAAELEVLGATPRALVIRTSALFGPDESRSFVANALAKIARGHRVYAAGDSTVSPTYLPDLVNACLDLLIDGESGIWHLSNTEPVTWADFARRAAWSTGLDGGKVVECKLADFGYAAPRPLYSALNSERAAFLLPTLEDAIRRFTRERSAICC